MKGPTRWQHDDSSPPEVRELLQRAKGAGRPRPLPPDSKARSAARLDRMLALPAAAGILLWLKGAAIAAGIGFVGVVAARQVLAPSTVAPAASSSVTSASPPSGHRPSVQPVAVPAPSAAPASAPSAGDVSVVDTTASAPAAIAPAVAATLAVAPRIEPAPSAAGDSIEREAAALDRARALLTSDPAAALSALDAQAAAFPAGHMGLERELLAVEALRRMHRLSEARARGEALLQRAPGSLYEGRVRAILDSLPPP